MKRPGVVTLLGVLDFIGTVACLGFGALLLLLAQSTQVRGPEARTVTLLVGMLWALGGLQLACGIGLWLLKPWGRILQLVLAWIGLLAIPIGTIVSILILIYLYKPGVKVLFAGRPAADLSSDELAQVAAASGSPLVVAIVVVVLAVLGFFAVSILAAIAVPGLVRARMTANEAMAVSTIRGVQSGEMAFSVAPNSGGLYAEPRCLARPALCLLGYSGEPFLAANQADPARGGYRFEFYPGPAADPRAARGFQPGATGITSFAYVATPVTFGTTGSRSFCGDSEGQLCAADSGALVARGGMCPAECRRIQ